MKVMVIQGPNINMLGKRERHIYGAMSMAQIHEQMSYAAKEAGVEIEFFQSNYEGELIDKIQECAGTADAIVLNAGGYSHTSIAIADAIAAVRVPTVEVHISNIYAREDFRRKSVLSAYCAGVIAGFGPFGYHVALMSAIQLAQQAAALANAHANTQAHANEHASEAK